MGFASRRGRGLAFLKGRAAEWVSPPEEGEVGLPERAHGCVSSDAPFSGVRTSEGHGIMLMYLCEAFVLS